VNAIDLGTVCVQDDALAAVSRTVAEIYEILPIRFEDSGRDLVIATSEPHSIDALTDLRFMLSCRILPVRADRDAIMAAIERFYVPRPLADMQEVLNTIAELDSRGVIAVARDWLRRTLRRFRVWLLRCYEDLLALDTCPTHAHFAGHVILATAESGTREATLETSGGRGLFHYETISKPHMSAKPEERACELDQPQVVLRFRVVPDEDGATFLQPGERPLDHPPAGRVSLASLLVQLLLAYPAYVRDVCVRLRRLAARRVVVALVETEILRRPVRRFGALNHY